MWAKKVIIIPLIVFIVLLITVDHIRPLFYYYNIKNEYWNIKEEINEVYEYLIRIEDLYVYIEEDYIIESDINSTINSRETNYVLNSEAGKKLFDWGYYKISKQENEVRFYKYKDIHGTYGICRLNAGANKGEHISLKEIDDGWCFFKNQ